MQSLGISISKFPMVYFTELPPARMTSLLMSWGCSEKLAKDHIGFYGGSISDCYNAIQGLYQDGGLFNFFSIYDNGILYQIEKLIEDSNIKPVLNTLATRGYYRFKGEEEKLVHKLIEANIAMQLTQGGTIFGYSGDLPCKSDFQILSLCNLYLIDSSIVNKNFVIIPARHSTRLLIAFVLYDDALASPVVSETIPYAIKTMATLATKKGHIAREDTCPTL